MIIGWFSITTDDNKGAWVRADEVGSFYEQVVYPKRGPGKPSAANTPQPMKVVTLCLRQGTRLHAKNETVETVVSKMKQATAGATMIWVIKADGNEVVPEIAA